jgi:hypothetical protein
MSGLERIACARVASNHDREALSPILQRAAMRHGCTLDEMFGGDKGFDAARARRAAILAVGEANPNWSAARIGRIFGIGRDHAAMILRQGGLGRSRGGARRRLEPTSRPVMPVPPQEASVKDIATAIARTHGCTLDEIRGERRMAQIVLARQEAMVAVAQARPDWSVYRIARWFGRHHATVLHAFKKLGYDHGRPKAPILTPEVRREREEQAAEYRRAVAAGERSPGHTVTLSPDAVRSIRRRLAAGERRVLLAREYGVSRSAIDEVATRKSWAWVK